MTSKDGNFAGSRDLQFRERQVPGATSHIVPGKRALVSFLTMSANSVFPPHCHEAEQIMTVFDGYMDEIIEGKLYRVKKGDVIVLPSNIEHGRYIREVGCTAIDIFTPPGRITSRSTGRRWPRPRERSNTPARSARRGRDLKLAPLACRADKITSSGWSGAGPTVERT